MDVRRLVELSPDERRALVDRDAGIGAIQDDVETIVNRVRREGDTALRHLAEEFDGVDLDEIDITDRAAAAVSELDADIREAIDRAAANIQRFHERQLPEDWRLTNGAVNSDADSGRSSGRVSTCPGEQPPIHRAR